MTVETRKRAAERKETNLRHTHNLEVEARLWGAGEDWCVWGERRIFEEVNMVKIVIQLNENVFVEATTVNKEY